jgi:hypothetical protein
MITAKTHPALNALALVTLAACSSGTSAGVSVLPSTPSTTTATSGFSADVLINVPFKSTQAVAARRPEYVSPSTQSIGIAIDNGAPAYTNLSTGNTNCKANAAHSSLQCVVPIHAKIGAHEASFITYDQPNGQGNKLSAAVSVGFKIAAGQNNIIPVTLGGIATSVAALPMSVAVAGSQSGGFTICGNNALLFTIVPADADGNYIIGPGSPTVSVTAQSPVTVNQVTPSDATAWTLQSAYRATDPRVAQQSTLHVVATPAAHSGGSVLNETINLTLYQPYVYVADPKLGIAALDERGDYEQWVMTGSNAVLSSTNALSFDPASGNLYVAGPAQSGQSQANPGAAVSGPSSASNPSSATGVAVDSANQSVYTTNADSTTDDIEQYTENGVSQNAFSISQPATAIVYGSSTGWLYGSSPDGTVEAFNQSGTAQFTVPVMSPSGITFNPVNDTLYVVSTGANGDTVQILNGATGASMGQFPIRSTAATGIAYDKYDDSLYIANGNTIDVYDPSGNLLNSSWGSVKFLDAFSLAVAGP